jgi:predicted dehydrogenase
VPLALAALGAGLHVVVEKPVALEVAAARQLAAAADRSGRLVSVFHNRRWDGDFLSLQRLLADGRLGRIAHLESHFDRYRPQVRDRWRERAGPGGGLWQDIGPHLVDQALRLFGPPERVTGQLAQLRHGALADDWVHVVLEYPALRVVLHASMIASGPQPRFIVHGETGSWLKHGFDVQEAQLRAGVRPGHAAWGVNAESGQLVDGPTGLLTETATARGAYQEFYSAFRDAVLGRGANPVPIADAIAVTAVVETAVASAHAGRTLPFSSNPATETA